MRNADTVCREIGPIGLIGLIGDRHMACDVPWPVEIPEPMTAVGLKFAISVPQPLDFLVYCGILN